MKAIVQDRYGSSETLQLREVDPPVPADDEVLIRVHAAAVNAPDWHVMRGDPFLARLVLPGLPVRGGPKHRIRDGTWPGGWRPSAGTCSGSGPATRCTRIWVPQTERSPSTPVPLRT